MCLNCGCGKPNDAHGNAKKNMTAASLKRTLKKLAKRIKVK